METRRGAVKNVLKNRVPRLFFTATRWDFVTPQIRDQDMNLRVISQLFCIHRFVVQSRAKYLKNVGKNSLAVLLWRRGHNPCQGIMGA